MCPPNYLNHAIGMGEVTPTANDSLTQRFISSQLTGKIFLPERYHFHTTLDSTNREAMTLAHNGFPEGTVIVADQQTQGRGRYGRVWASPPGLNLYFSLLLRPPIAVCQASQLTLLAGLALVETVVGMGVGEALLKWPNDIMVNGRKLAGILAEMASDGERIRFMVIGVGVNVNGSATHFPAEIAQRAITMAEILHKELVRGLLLVEFLRLFEYWYLRYLQEGFAPIRQGWLAHSALLGRQVQVALPQGGMVGEAMNLDEDGFLLVKESNGIVSRVMAGDVALL